MKKTRINNWKTLNLISDDNISKVYKIIKEDGKLAVVKTITLPVDDADAAALMEKGKILFIQDATNYYLQKMNKEIEILKSLSSNKNILHLETTFQDNQDNKSSYHMLMEYAEDISTSFIKTGISENDIVKIGIDICSALEAITSKNIIHNDIKPNNIFFDGENYKLGDFGNSTEISKESVVYFGSPNYISPEVYKNEIPTPQSDIYSLGLVMYKLLTGELPFVTNEITEEEAFGIRMSGKEITLDNNYNNKLSEIILKACNFSKNNRYQSASEMKNDLLEITTLSTKKNEINFSDSKLNDTISVFDSNLIASQGKNNEEIIAKTKKAKRSRNLKKHLKRTIKICVLLLLLLIIGVIYLFNRPCDLGFINKNGVCTKGYYLCEDGYVLNEENKCQKTIKTEKAKVSYSCKKGYVYTEGTCVSTETKEPEFVYQCLEGFSLSGTKCIRTETNDAVITYTCPKGYANMNGVCIKGDEQDAKASYSCPNTYTKGPFLEGGVYKCSKYNTSTITEEATKKYTCTKGTLNKNNKCVVITENVAKTSCTGTYSNETCQTKYCSYWGGYQYPCGQTCTGTCTTTTNPTVSYSCNNNVTPINGKCTYSGGNTIKVSATVTYTCPKGYDRIGNKCVYGKQINGTPVYTCLDSQKLVGSKCETTVSTDAVGMYVCPTGFVASGITCIQNEFPTPIKKYTCSRVYTLNGDNCEKYETKPAKAVYTE